MPRSPASILFAATLCLSLALVGWWTVFQVRASRELEQAGQHLGGGDVAAAARAFGVDDAPGVIELARTRRTMFVSEGVAFVAVLLVTGWLFAASARREAALRTTQDRFLAGATHELKTPLATIVLLLESLRDDRVPPEKRARWLDNGLLEAERLERGLNNVLTAAGLRSSRRIGASTSAGDLAADVRAAAAALQARATTAHVQLELAVPESLPAVRDGVSVQLVLRNLIDNAIKFSPPGATVRIALAPQGREAEIRVRDDGRGLDADELANAFRPFWRGSDAVTGGTGLGLHLVHELVTLHGGRVAAHSAGRDRGAEFVVRLPVAGGAA